MRKFKFELGDSVVHATRDNHHSGFVVIGRYILEMKLYTEEKYLISSYEMGQIIRQTANIEELRLTSINK